MSADTQSEFPLQASKDNRLANEDLRGPTAEVITGKKEPVTSSCLSAMGSGKHVLRSP